MLKFIFKNFDNFLESLRKSVLSLFSKKSKKSRGNIKPTPSMILEQEIKKQELNLKEKTNLYAKNEIRKKILYLKLKLKALNSSSRYLKRAEDILRDEVEESAYEALSYLNRAPQNLEDSQKVEIKLFTALVYELLEDFEAAGREYKEALQIDKSGLSLREYKEYVQRSRLFFSWHSKSRKRLLENSYNIHNIVPEEKLPEVANRLEKIASYYARSPKSRALGKSYFNEVLKIYKKLSEKHPKEYSCAYIQVLLDGVEIFMMSPRLLTEAEELLTGSRDCIDMRVYLLERIKELRQKGFIQKSLSRTEQ
jgi:tetratricopeptide (TPR) repeat protein